MITVSPEKLPNYEEKVPWGCDNHLCMAGQLKKAQVALTCISYLQAHATLLVPSLLSIKKAIVTKWTKAPGVHFGVENDRSSYNLINFPFYGSKPNFVEGFVLVCKTIKLRHWCSWQRNIKNSI